MDRLTYRLKDQWENPTDSIILKPYMRYQDEDTKHLILNRLAYYEDLEEQGRLIILASDEDQLKTFEDKCWICPNKDTCPKCGVFINKDKTKYIDKPKKHKTKTNTETCRCLKTEDYKEYWGQWIECDCGFTSNVECAKYCGGCGKEIEVVGIKPSEWEGFDI